MHMRLRCGAAVALLFSLPAGVLAHSKEDYANMGPLGFMWPPDREWNEEHGMEAPCGTAAGPVNRTEFPLTPSSNDDFVIISPYQNVSSLEWSHVCIDIPGLPEGGQAGQNATLRLHYTAEYIDPNHHHKTKRHTPVNETFYACADVTLVTREVFTFDVPCFNATADYGAPQADHDHDQSGAEESTEQGDGSTSSGSSGLSKEAIAGIVIGSVVGAAVIATVAWYFYRRDKREKQVAQQMANIIEK
ncbi:hypothetical protein ACHAQH_005318 [Verticillium albo-atrum]